MKFFLNSSDLSSGTLRLCLQSAESHTYTVAIWLRLTATKPGVINWNCQYGWRAVGTNPPRSILLVTVTEPDLYTYT